MDLKTQLQFITFAHQMRRAQASNPTEMPWLAGEAPDTPRRKTDLSAWLARRAGPDLAPARPEVCKPLVGA